jgi:aminopeptidase N
MLRGLVGEQAFFAGARACLDRYRYAKAGTEDLRAALEAVSGQQLKAYFDRWIYETGLPSLTWSARTAAAGSGFRTTVSVATQGLPGPLPLQVSVTSSAGTETRIVRLTPDGGDFAFDTREPPRRIALNEDRGLLARVTRSESPAQR